MIKRLATLFVCVWCVWGGATPAVQALAIKQYLGGLNSQLIKDVAAWDKLTPYKRPAGRGHADSLESLLLTAALPPAFIAYMKLQSYNPAIASLTSLAQQRPSLCLESMHNANKGETDVLPDRASGKRPEMKWMLQMITLSCADLRGASQDVNVAVCNMGGLRDRVIADAKAEAVVIYRSAGVQILWHTCDEYVSTSVRGHSPWLLIRLLNNQSPVRATSLDVMGRAIMLDCNGGDMADAYYHTIQAVSRQDRSDPGVLLGYVIAHELGHLLLGPDHTPDGVMRAVWGPNQIDCMYLRWLKFDKGSARRIRQAVDMRTTSAR